MRGRMALSMAGIDFEHREILLRDKPSDMLEASPKGTVPVIVLSDGRVIDESLDVMRWALDKNDPLNWLSNLEDSLTIIADNDGPFKYHLDRYKYASRYDDKASRGDTDTAHKEAAETFLMTLEQRLEKHAYLLGKDQKLADIAVFPFIRQFANTDRENWETNRFPKTRGWLNRHLTSDIFINIMTKHPLWSPKTAS